MGVGSSMENRSYFYALDTKFEYGNVTLFTYFSEFNRPWKGSSYVEAAVMTAMFVLSVIGNVFILGLTLKSKTSRTVTNYFVCNLAIGDILFVSSAPFIAYVRITETWRLGDGMCHILNYGMFVCATAMIWTMAVISVDRFFCIYRGSMKQLKPSYVTLVCISIWIVSGCFFLPIGLFFHEKVAEFRGETISFCTLLWPRAHFHYSILFVTMFMSLTFVLPVVIIVFNYYKIFRKFWSSKRAIGAVSRIDSNNRKRYKLRNRDIKVVKTLILLVVMFVIMWLPLFSVMAVLHHHLLYDNFTLPSYGLTWALIVAYLNPCVNPFLYGFINSELCQNVMFCCGQNDNAQEDPRISHTMVEQNMSTRVNISTIV